MLIRVAPAIFVLIWATGFIGSKLGSPHAEPFTFLALRFAIALTILTALSAFISWGTVSRRQYGYALLVGLLVQGIYLGGIFYAIDHGMTAGFAALLVGFQPIVTSIMAFYNLKQTIRLTDVVVLAIGFAGVVMVLAPDLIAGSGNLGATPANLAVGCIAVLAISAGTILQKKHLGGISMIANTTTQYVAATGFTALIAVSTERMEISWTGEFLFALAWLVVVLSLGGIALLMYLINQRSILNVASLFFLVPGVAALIAWPLFGETLQPLQIAGFAVAMAAIAVSSRKIV